MTTTPEVLFPGLKSIFEKIHGDFEQYREKNCLNVHNYKYLKLKLHTHVNIHNFFLYQEHSVKAICPVPFFYLSQQS